MKWLKHQYYWRTKKWRKRYLFWRLRNATTCHYCTVSFGPKGSKREKTLDHYLPKSKGGSWRLSNIVPACGKCNRLKGDTHGDEFRASARLAARLRGVKPR